MIIRNTRYSDIDDVLEIYALARAFMRDAGNATQWNNGYPARQTIECDIEEGNGYVVEENGEIICAFFFRVGVDPTYVKIYGGEWLNDKEYGVIHRIAVKYQGRGLVSFVYNYCFNIINNLRIDTHRDNLPMQKSLTKNGFRYCGVIYLENGDERIAYQKAE